MTWIGEVAHVAWKDLRQQRWLVVAYVALVALATTRAASHAMFDRPSSPFSVAMLLVVLLGCILAAVVMQGDSPIRTDAFWLSRPFRPSAMLTAKLLFVAVIVVLFPLLGEAIGLAAFDVPRGDLPLLLFGCLTTFGMWLLMSVLLGSLTSDLRSFVVAFIVVLVATGLLTGYLASTRLAAMTSTRSTAVTIGIAAVVLGLLALVLLYLQRSRRQLAWIMAGIASAGALPTIFAGPFPTAGSGSSVSVGPLEASVAYPASHVGEGRLAFTVAARQAPDSLTSEFLVDGVTAELADGSRLNLREVLPSPVRLHTADLPLGSVSWLRHNFKAPEAVTVMLTEDEQQALARGVRGYQLRGRVVTLRPRALGAIPLRPGSQLNSSGSHTRIARLVRIPGDVKVEVSSLMIDSPDQTPERFLPGNERFTFALVNARAGQGLVLVPNGSGRGSDWLVLPGTQVNESTFQLQAGMPRVPGIADLSDAWYRDASLVIARWETLGSYSTTIHVGGT